MLLYGQAECCSRLIAATPGDETGVITHAREKMPKYIWVAQMIRLVLLMAWALPLAPQDASLSDCHTDPVAWIAPEASDHACLASNRPGEILGPCIPTLKFWRLHMESAKGDWHLYNEEDKRFLQQTAQRIANGQYKHTKLEWTTLTGSLPK